MSKGREIDMVHGSLFKKIVAFALPLIGSGVLQQSFNAVDIAVVGRFCGSHSMAAVGCNGPIINILLNLFIGISVGANVVIANYIGQQHRRAIRDSVETVQVIALASGILLAFLGTAFAVPMLEMMDTPGEVLGLASDYLRIYFLGMPFLMIYNFGAAIMRSMGDTKRPFYALVVSGLVNVAFNLMLVLLFDMGVRGVAIATVCANIVNAAMVVWWLSHEQEPYRVHYRRFNVVKRELVKMLKIGVPAGVQGMVFSFANIFIQASINGYGPEAMAGSAAALNYEMYCYFVISAFAQAAVAFVSQNYGAGDLERCRRVTRQCMLLAMLFSGVANIGISIFGNIFIIPFTDSPAVMEYALIRLHYVLMFQWIASSYEISGAAMRGMGHSLTPTLITIFGTCVLRLVWIYFMSDRGFATLLIIYPITWTVTGIMTLAAYKWLLRKERSQFRSAAS